MAVCVTRSVVLAKLFFSTEECYHSIVVNKKCVCDLKAGTPDSR